MVDVIRFRLPVPPVVNGWTPLDFIGQDTKVDGQPAIITNAVLRHDSGGDYLDIEAEVLGIVRELHGEVLPGMYSIAAGPDRLPQGSFRTKAEALAYAQSLPPKYHVLGEDGEIVPCDHPACEHCRGRETP